MQQPAAKESPFVFRIERTFDATRERVWKAWTVSEQFKQWFGPKGCKMIYTDVDLRPGGHSRYGMEFAGHTMYGQWAYVDIVVPEKIVAIVSFLDENGNKTKHPMNPDWPMDIHSVVIFTDLGDKTKITVEWTAHNPTASESRVFEEGASSMNQGWGGTFDQLDEFLQG